MREVGKVDARGRERVQTINDGESMTVQSDAHLADIQNIMATFGIEGMQKLNEVELEYKDVSEFTDLADAIKQAEAAEEQFFTLPSKVREIFGHNVATWLDTAHDEDKRDALVKAGFLKDEKSAVREGGAEAAKTAAQGAGGEGTAGAAAEGSEGQGEVAEVS